MERRLAAILAADMVGYSRLMERDEESVLARQKNHRRELIDPEISRNRGRIVKTTGDGMIAEFASAQDAVRCSLDIQSQMARREAGSTDDDRIQYRIGINLGDVIFDEDDVFGDGVNVASRLEGLARPGGVCVSDPVLQSVGDHVSDGFRDMGSQRVKNITRPIRVWQWSLDDPVKRQAREQSLNQRVRFCSSSDGTQIAFASIGEGPVILKAPNWLNHIEYEWESPVWGAVINELATRSRLVRFDQRGTGLSDWHAEEISEDAMVRDMEAVVDAAGLDRFALLGFSQGASYSIRYALKHPQRVSCLIFCGGYLRGRNTRESEEQTALYEASLRMIELGWGSPNPLFRQGFTSSFIPDASPEQQMAFDELQRISTDSRNAKRLFQMMAEIQIVEMARELRIPTLILHARGDRVAPVEEGRLMARTIPGASFVELPGNNHPVMEGSPAFDRFFEEAMPFVTAHA